MSAIEKEKLLKELEELEKKRLEINSILENIMVNNYNQLEAQRLKKIKLKLKDQIDSVKSILYPDIIA